MSASQYDILSNIELNTEPIVPPWIGLRGKEKDQIQWFEETLRRLEDFSQLRIETAANNLLWYTGEYDKTFEYRANIPGSNNRGSARRIIPRIFNHLFDITEQRVSKLSRYKPSFDSVPTNREEKDRLVARMIKQCIFSVARRVHMENLIQEAERWAAVFGEVFIAAEWNTEIGDRKSRGSLERVGDVDVWVKAPWMVLPEPKRKWEDVNWVIEIDEIMQLDECRKRFKMPSIEKDGKTWVFGFNQDLQEKRDDEVVVYRVVEKPCQFNEKGRFTYIVSGKIVDQTKEYPYSHNDFPFERHTDIDVPGRLFAMSFYQQIKPIQHVYNKLTSIMVRNMTLVGHPHILMPKGAAKIEAFGNTHTAIEYAGPVEPKIVTFPAVPQEFFQLRNEVRQELGQVSGIQGVSRGAPPPGARAASMLRFYEEQEEQRASTQIIKHNELIRRIYLKIGSIIGDYYPTTSKDRLIRIVGPENQYMVEAFEGAKISSEYDIIIVNSTGFSESMAGRLEEIQMLQQMAPGLLSPEQMADVLELKNPQKAYDSATAALKHAEEENERFLDGKDVPSPQPYQDLIVHWKQHLILINSSTWENNVPKKIKEAMEAHMVATEMLMEKKAEINSAFAQTLGMLPGYPAFWTPTPRAEGPAEAQPQAQQQGPEILPTDLGINPGMEVPPPEMGGDQALPDVPSALTNGPIDGVM